jgi:hypothetical protein
MNRAETPNPEPGTLNRFWPPSLGRSQPGRFVPQSIPLDSKKRISGMNGGKTAFKCLI